MGRAKWRVPVCDFYEARLMELLDADAKGLSWNEEKAAKSSLLRVWDAAASAIIKTTDETQNYENWK